MSGDEAPEGEARVEIVDRAYAEPPLGLRLRRATWWATGVQVIAALVGLTSPVGRVAAAVVAGALFAAGCVGFLSAYAIALGRSRTEAVGVGGLYFLGGDVAPSSVRRSFLGSLAAQTVVGIAAGVARPYSPMAFLVLVPVAGLAASGLWGARYGAFGARQTPQGRLPVGGAAKNRAAPAGPGTVASAPEPPDMEQNDRHG